MFFFLLSKLKSHFEGCFVWQVTTSDRKCYWTGYISMKTQVKNYKLC